MPEKVPGRPEEGRGGSDRGKVRGECREAGKGHCRGLQGTRPEGITARDWKRGPYAYAKRPERRRRAVFAPLLDFTPFMRNCAGKGTECRERAKSGLVGHNPLYPTRKQEQTAGRRVGNRAISGTAPTEKPPAPYWMRGRNAARYVKYQQTFPVLAPCQPPEACYCLPCSKIGTKVLAMLGGVW